MGDSVKKAEVKQTNDSNNSLQFQKFCKYLDSYKYIWKAKTPRLVFTKAIPHVILKQQQRKASSFTSNQQMAVDHSNWITTITNGGIYVRNKFSWCLTQWHSLTFLRRLCTQGCLHFFKKIAGREATRQENVCWVLTVQVLIFLWNYVKPHRKRD